MTPTLTVSQFIDFCNVALDATFPEVIIEGEVSGFKINQGKWVFFDLKDEESSLNCFLPLSKLTVALADGMKVRVAATPKLTKWGRFSLTIRRIAPVGEGSIKKSYELLKAKLTKEGLFAPERKRPLPEHPQKIAVISSTAAAGYIDFLKILSNRWGGLEISVVNTQVQGLAAPAQITKALRFFNERGGYDVIAILRGGGSADDLSAFNDEELVRAIAASKIPVITGIGHEIDESLADLAADIRASTPSNAAERLTPDKTALLVGVKRRLAETHRTILSHFVATRRELSSQLQNAHTQILQNLRRFRERLAEREKLLQSLNPELVLRRGYAIIKEKSPPEGFKPGTTLHLSTSIQYITTEVKDVKQR